MASIRKRQHNDKLGNTVYDYKDPFTKNYKENSKAGI